MRVGLIVRSDEHKKISTFVRHQNLHDYTRPLIAETLSDPMRRGHPVVIRTDGNPDDAHILEALKHDHRYDYHMVDLGLNLKAEWRKAIAPLANGWFDGNALMRENRQALDVLEDKYAGVHNLDHVPRVHHIGDIHGCYEPLFEYMKTRYNPHDFYIFTGDFFDRGPDNVRVFLYLEKLMKKSNVVFIWGNHENDLHRYATGQKLWIEPFRDVTQHEFRRAGITPQRVEAFVKRLRDVFIYEKDGVKVICSHAGLSHVPSRFVTVPSRHYRKGDQEGGETDFGRFRLSLPQAFRLSAKGQKIIQVHGHSNTTRRSSQESCIMSDPQSFNVNDCPERGGHLRVLVMENRNSVTPYYIESNHVSPLMKNVQRSPTQAKMSGKRKGLTFGEAA